MKVSIVIPAYNEEKIIGDCLRAIEGQTRAPDEVIVVDNNSKDRTSEIAKSFSFVRVVHEPNQGMIQARNRGVSEATGDIIARCDADTFVSPTWIEAITNSFANADVDAISGPAYYYDLPAKEFFKSLQEIIFFKTWKFFKHHETMFGSNMAFTKSIWNKVLPNLAQYDEDMHEDMDLAIHIHRIGGKIRFVPSMVANISARRFTSSFGSLPSYIRRYIKAFFV